MNLERWISSVYVEEREKVINIKMPKTFDFIKDVTNKWNSSKITNNIFTKQTKKEVEFELFFAISLYSSLYSAKLITQSTLLRELSIADLIKEFISLIKIASIPSDNNFLISNFGFIFSLYRATASSALMIFSSILLSPRIQMST